MLGFSFDSSLLIVSFSDNKKWFASFSILPTIGSDEVYSAIILPASRYKLFPASKLIPLLMSSKIFERRGFIAFVSLRLVSAIKSSWVESKRADFASAIVEIRSLISAVFRMSVAGNDSTMSLMILYCATVSIGLSRLRSKFSA